MDIKKRFASLLKKSKNRVATGYRWETSLEGLDFFISQEEQQQVQNGNVELWLIHQHVVLNMLAEEGLAEVIPSGFIVPSATAVNLDEMTREALELPPQWKGHIDSTFDGRTGNSAFALSLELEVEPSRYTGTFQLDGPILKFSDEKTYLQTPEQANLFSAWKKHRESEKNESDNLQLVLALQDAKKSGLNISLAQFDRLDVQAPDSVSISIELSEDGDLLLTPTFGQSASPEKIQQVLWQLRQKNTNVIRVGGEIILLDEERLSAVHEILHNRVVPKEKIKDFLATPTAYIDASMVDLDVGFSARVKGATVFQQAYFGESDDSGIDWFGLSTSTNSEILLIVELPKYIRDLEDLLNFQKSYLDASATGAKSVIFRKKAFDISDNSAVDQVLKDVEDGLQEGRYPEPDSTTTADVDGPDGDTDDDPPSIGGDDTGTGSNPTGESNPIPESNAGPAVVDIFENDAELEYSLQKSIKDNSFSEKLVYDDYLRKPFKHQEEGIRWIIGLASNAKASGGLLADDMGLGKTYMSLAAMDQLYKLQKQQSDKKPNLIIAPLSVLQNWKDEVEKTFSLSPFKDVVILQASGDMKRFRIGGVETQQTVDDGAVASIRYALKIGDSFLNDRLDIPSRLVVTTYQTLRDYQFSLCSIDWGMVVFDEAQNIKNPNAIQTRAAKGLKSDFKLLVTGTPVENSLTDFWCLMDTAVPGHLNSFQSFREKYVKPILEAAQPILDVVNNSAKDMQLEVGKTLRKDVGYLMLRRTKEDVFSKDANETDHSDDKALPQKTVYVGIDDDAPEDNLLEYRQSLASTMNDFQLATYQAVIKDYQEAETNQALACLHKLRDISLHPQLSDQGALISRGKTLNDLKKVIGESKKLNSLLAQLNEIKKEGQKCIIFCINKRLQEFLSVALTSLYSVPVRVINGDTKAVAKTQSAETRKSIIAAFEAREGFNIIVMSPIAAGVGLTVTGANHVIHLERHWNPAKEAQASDRVYRIGQKLPVSIYIPILHHPDFESFDVNLHRLLSKKTVLRNAVVTSEQVVPSPSTGDDEEGVKVNYQITGDDIVRLSWQQFEYLCAEILAKEHENYNVWLTAAGPDYKADVALISKESEATKDIILVQCKHTKGQNYQGYDGIQEIFAAAHKYENKLQCKVSKKLLFTNAKKITAKAQADANDYGVEIVAYPEIEKLLNIYNITIEMLFKRQNNPRLKI